jgi:hypothetical protein
LKLSNIFLSVDKSSCKKNFFSNNFQNHLLSHNSLNRFINSSAKTIGVSFIFIFSKSLSNKIKLYNIAKFFLFFDFSTNDIAQIKFFLFIKLNIFLSSSSSISNQKKLLISLSLGLLKLSIDSFMYTLFLYSSIKSKSLSKKGTSQIARYFKISFPLLVISF